MKQKITSLTLEQEEKFTEYRDKWLKIGLSTEPCDRGKAESAVRELYKYLEFKTPITFIWTQSPLGGVFAAGCLKSLYKFDGSLQNKILHLAITKPYAQIRKNVRARVIKKVVEQVLQPIENRVEHQVFEPIFYQTEKSIKTESQTNLPKEIYTNIVSEIGGPPWKNIAEQVLKETPYQLRQARYGSHVAAGLAYFEYFLEVANIKNLEFIRPFIEISKNAEWWWVFDDTVVFSEKPVEINIKNTPFKKDNRTTVKYKDGFSMDYSHENSFWK